MTEIISSCSLRRGEAWPTAGEEEEEPAAKLSITV